MKISYNWLKDFLSDLSISPEQVAEMLTLHTVETVVAEEIKIDPSIVIVQIKRIEPHPDADRLRLATISDGTQEVRVVCGAPNIEEGQIVPYAPPGTVVKDAEGEDFKIKTAKIRGIESPGMLSSLRELGLHHEHAGIWILPNDTPIGSKLSEQIADDTILDLDVTPNRAHDLMSHRGVARELAALLEIEIAELKEADLPQPSEEVDGYTVQVEESMDTPRYIGAVLKGARNGVSPLWMQARLLAAGTKPISSIVDITNYVMYEIGNPSHAFDQTKLPNQAIGVRRAKEGEELTLLDETRLSLSPDLPVITVGDKPIALAGIMGGIGTEVEKTTEDIFLEVANFRPFLIQEAMRLSNTRTEASARFSKGLSPVLVEEATGRIAYLLEQICGARLNGIIDTHPSASAHHKVVFKPKSVPALAGIDIDQETIHNVLQRLRFEIDEKEDEWIVSIPYDRLDISIEVDLIEEVIRVVGLENIEGKPLSDQDSAPLPAYVYWKEYIRDFLSEKGFTETLNYSFEPSETASIVEELRAASGESLKVEVASATSPDQKYMRTSLLPGLLKNILTNKDDFHRKFSNQERALFEIGKVYRKGDGTRVPGVIEREYIAGVVVGGQPDIRHVIDELTQKLETTLPNTIDITELPSDILARLKYRLSVTVFEFDLEEFIEHAKEISLPATQLEDLRQSASAPITYTSYSRQPSVYRDISMLINPSVTVEQVQELMARIGGELVVDIDNFDEFEAVGTNKKSLAFHIEYQASDRTLTDKEVETVHEKIVQALSQEFSAEIR